jgi:hypothetical protein
MGRYAVYKVTHLSSAASRLINRIWLLGDRRMAVFLFCCDYIAMHESAIDAVDGSSTGT